MKKKNWKKIENKNIIWILKKQIQEIAHKMIRMWLRKIEKQNLF